MTEMDKARDERRGASRVFKQQSAHKLSSGLNGVGVGGDFGSLEKSKTERVKRLSAVCKDSSGYEEMGCCDVSDREDEQNLDSVTNVGSGKRFKLPKKLFDDCKGVRNSPVPRKLRSAMKKRNRESVSPPLPDAKKLNQAIGETESPKKDGERKSRLNMIKGGMDWSHKQAGSGPITKDEEEVVETLYSLAGMFHDNDIMDQEDKLDCQEANSPASPALPEAGEGPTSIKKDSVAVEEDSSYPSRTSEPTDSSSNLQKFPEEIVDVDCSNQPIVQEQSNLPNCKTMSLDLDGVIPQLNSPVIPLLVRNDSEKTQCDAIDLRIPPKENQHTSMLKEVNEEESSPLQQKPETTLGLTMARGDQMNQQQKRNMEPKKIALWPGLSSALPNGAHGHGPEWSSNVKVPAWLDTSVSVFGQNSFENGSSIGKVSLVKNDNISWKRCAAHVYISHRIRALKMPDGGNKVQLYLSQARQQEAPKPRVLAEVNNFNGIRSGLDGVSSTIGSSNCSDKKLNEVSSDVYSHGRLHQDQQQTSVAFSEYPSPKQGLDFLSLSYGSRGIETNNNLGRIVSGSERQSSQRQVPHLQSRAQHPTLMSLPQPQMHYTAAYPDQPTAATQQTQLQLHHPYLGRPFYSPSTSTTSLTKQQHLRYQQQQFWTAQFALPLRPAGTSTSMAPFPSWHNARQESTSLIPRSQPVIPPSLSSLEVLGLKHPQISQQQPQLIPNSQLAIPPSPSSLEVLGAKYSQISLQQQQHPMAISSSLPPAGAKRQDHHLYSVYEETGGSFCASVALPLQLFCNDRL